MKIIKLIIKSLIVKIHPFFIILDIHYKNLKKFFFNSKFDIIFNKEFEFKILKNVNDFIKIKEKIIITMTSWKKELNIQIELWRLY